MTLEQLVKALEDANSLWDLNSIGLPAIKEGLADVSRRLKALERATPKK
jgi:hypothetical protein